MEYPAGGIPFGEKGNGLDLGGLTLIGGFPFGEKYSFGEYFAGNISISIV